MPTIQAHKIPLSQILPLRTRFLQEGGFQVRYNACHNRNWADAYLLTADGQAAGYGAVKGKDDLMRRDAIFEFYLLPGYRSRAPQAFAELLRCSGAMYVECQSNDLLLSSMLYEFTSHISADTILFADDTATALPPNGARFRPRTEADLIPWLQEQDIGSYVLEAGGAIIGTGGFLTHYNPPFADLFMAVRAEHRNRGYGAYLVQELKKACKQAGYVPGARCVIDNRASRACLLKAGFKVVGYMLAGEVRKVNL